jgi:general secretion pathway protein G
MIESRTTWNARSRARRHIRTANRGFTLLEIMIVCIITVTLLAMAAVSYKQSLIRANEAALHQDLFVLRNAIDQYTADKEAGPNSLDDLVSANYLREIPSDPMTHQKDWNTLSDDTLLSPDETTPGITDVHSASGEVSPFEHTPYSSW